VCCDRCSAAVESALLVLCCVESFLKKDVACSIYTCIDGSILLDNNAVSFSYTLQAEQLAAEIAAGAERSRASKERALLHAEELLSLQVRSPNYNTVHYAAALCLQKR
jgi:hypothetical protein